MEPRTQKKNGKKLGTKNLLKRYSRGKFMEANLTEKVYIGEDLSGT